MAEEHSEATGSKSVAELALPRDCWLQSSHPKWHQWDQLPRLASRGLLNPWSSCCCAFRPSPAAG